MKKLVFSILLVSTISIYAMDDNDSDSEELIEVVIGDSQVNNNSFIEQFRKEFTQYVKKKSLNQSDVSNTKKLIRNLEKERSNFNNKQQEQVFNIISDLNKLIDSRIKSIDELKKDRKNYIGKFLFNSVLGSVFVLAGLLAYPSSSNAYYFYGAGLLEVAVALIMADRAFKTNKEIQIAPERNRQLRKVWSHLEEIKFKPLWLRELATIKNLDEEIMSYKELVAYRDKKQSALTVLKQKSGKSQPNTCVVCLNEKEQLISPCLNKDCQPSICDKCVPNLFNNSDKCPTCRSDLDLGFLSGAGINSPTETDH